jgi:polysaccharide pyruvyl transferase WcaK-like protein
MRHEAIAKKKNILLLNSFAVNNGDMALVVALYDQLKARGYSVRIATFYFNFLKSRYPELPLVRELLDYPIKGGTFVRKIFLAINFLFNYRYRDHDVFIAAPGGYVNSFYGLKRCLLPLVLSKRIGKRTAIYSQSVGPLNERDKRLLADYSKSIDVILVRDEYSLDYISKVECHSKVSLTKDAAFLTPPRESTADSNNKLVAVSVRAWEFDDRNMDKYITMIEQLCILACDRGFDIEFISTCQGVKGYRDDSKVALMIQQRIVIDRPELEKRIRVNAKYHTYHELSDRLNTRYVFVIGTRLHMCILSLLNGVPAFNISYEVKGRECYNYLQLEKYSIDFNEPTNLAVNKFSVFVDSYPKIRAGLMVQLREVHDACVESLNRFLIDMRL